MKKLFSAALLLVLSSSAFAEITKTSFYCQGRYLFLSILKIDENTGRIERDTKQTDIYYQSEQSCVDNAAILNQYK